MRVAVTLSERMAQFETAVREAAEAARERERLATEIGRELADRVETAVAEAGTTVEAVDRSAEDGFITAVPTREQVIERATALGVPSDAAADRLDRLDTLDMVDFEDGEVYPGENFSRL